MATDLVRWGNTSDGDGGRDSEHEEEDEWNRPPVAPRPYGRSGPIHDGRSEAGARGADRDVADAEARGDGTFARLRAGDAADLRQSRWDWGDLRTWTWIIGMCVAYLLMSAVIYYLPHGRHDQNDGSNPTPNIRVY